MCLRTSAARWSAQVCSRAAPISRLRSGFGVAASGSASPPDGSARSTPRPIPAQSEAHVCRDTAEPGGDGVFPSEIPYVAAYPDPNLLAHVLGVVTPNTRIVTPRTRPEWVPTRREKVATSPREARGTPSVPLPVHR
jgi:hypothetical protein